MCVCVVILYHIVLFFCVTDSCTNVGFVICYVMLTTVITFIDNYDDDDDESSIVVL